MIRSTLSRSFLSCLLVAAMALPAIAMQTAPPVPDAAARPGKRGAEVRYGVAPALPRKAGTMRIAGYNAENLFDDVDDPALSGEYDDITMKTSDDRLRSIADAIRAVDADVIGLAEVESLAALRWFRDKYLPDMGYDYIASDDVGYYRGVEQSVLSRFPIVRQKVWPDADLKPTASQRVGEGWTSAREGQGEKFQRSPLFVQVRTPDGYLLDLIVVHQKAGGKDFAFHREAEALKIIELVKERLAEDPNARIAVLGDFNASPSEKSLKIYLDPAFGGLSNAWEERFDQNKPRDTFVTHSSGRVIDYIFTTPMLKSDLVPKSFFVFATLAPPDGWNWRTDQPPAGYASDHRPLVVDLVARATEERPAARETKLWDAKPGAPAQPSPPGAKPPAPASKDAATPSQQPAAPSKE